MKPDEVLHSSVIFGMSKMTQSEQSQAPGNRMVCIGCARTMPENADFCPFCGAPMGATAFIDPYKRIVAGGYLNRKLVSGKPRKWVFAVEFALAIICAPVSVVSLVHADSIPEIVLWILGLALSAVLCWRMIQNYTRLYGKRADSRANAAMDAHQ